MARPQGPSSLGAVEFMYPSIRSNISLIASKESKVYNYDL